MQLTLKKNEQDLVLEFKRQGEDFVLEYLNKSFAGKLLQWEPPYFVLESAGKTFKGAFYRGENFIDVHLPSGTTRLHYPSRRGRGASAHEEGDLLTPMPGKVLKVLVDEGEAVNKGQSLMVLEAMKMEHQIISPLDGKVAKINFKEGDRVQEGEELMEVRES